MLLWLLLAGTYYFSISSVLCLTGHMKQKKCDMFTLVKIKKSYENRKMCNSMPLRHPGIQKANSDFPTWRQFLYWLSCSDIFVILYHVNTTASLDKSIQEIKNAYISNTLIKRVFYEYTSIYGYDYIEFKNCCINIRANRDKLSVFLSFLIPFLLGDINKMQTDTHQNTTL